MEESMNREPKLIFFRHHPENLISSPPLASSLQHLETSFLLIVIKRYPHALVACGSAIESAIKAAINAGPHDRLDFKGLIEQARKKYPSFTRIHDQEIKNFRLKRNEIIHYGFSTKDDEVSTKLLLETGYRLIAECYETFFQFPLEEKDGVYGSLLPDLAYHLNVAKKVYMKAKDEKGLDLTYCFISFRKNIALGIQHWMLSDWQKILIQSEEESAYKHLFYFKENQKERLSGHYFNDLYWTFNCPVCGSQDSFVVELDGERLDKSEIRLLRGACVDCSLVIPDNCPFITDILCEDQIDIEKPKIFKEYMIK